VVFSATGQILAEATREYSPVFPAPGMAEIDPRTFWEAFCDVTRRAAAQVSDPIAGVAVSSHGETFFPANAKGEPIGPAVFNMDNRAIAETQWWEDTIGRKRLFQITGLVAHPMYPMAKIRWMQLNQPDVFTRTARFRGVIYYIMAQLAWNPARDVDALLDDYFCRGFGPVAGAVKAYWTLMEEAYHRRADGNLAEAEVYDSSFFAKAEDILNRADAALVGQPDVLRKRLAVVRTGLEYTRLLTEIRTLIEGAKSSTGADADANGKVRAKWDRIEELCRQSRTIINVQFFRRDGIPMRKLNPDYLERK
jgi:hypothetical protein